MLADDGDLRGLGRTLGQEVAAEDGLDAEDVEKVGKGADAADEKGVIVVRPTPVEPCWRMLRSSKVVDCLRQRSKWRGLAPV